MSGTTYDGLVIDAHCHIASTRFIPLAFFEGLCRNVKVRLAATGVNKSLTDLLAMYVKLSQDHQGDALGSGQADGLRNEFAEDNVDGTQ